MGSGKVTSCVRFLSLLFLLMVTTGRAQHPRPPNNDDRIPNPPFREPVILKADPDAPAPEYNLASTATTKYSPTGVLDVELTLSQGSADMNSNYGGKMTNCLLYSYRLIRGSSSDGSLTGEHLYPGPTLLVQPGQTLIMRIKNLMSNLTIPDFFDPIVSMKDESIPTYKPTLEKTVYNNHIHGMHISPNGNSDNVLLTIPAGKSNRYTYRIPSDDPHGVYWYHSHQHRMTSPHTYMGLAGLLVIGDNYGGLPVVEEKKLKTRTMTLQYNWVFGRDVGLQPLSTLLFNSMVSTVEPPTKENLLDGSYNPKLCPANMYDTPVGYQMHTGFWSGNLSPSNNRGAFSFLPQNLREFVAYNDSRYDMPRNRSVPDIDRDVQWTVNGQFQPSLSATPGSTELWTLANTADFGYARVQVRNNVTGEVIRTRVVGQDGNPYPAANTSMAEDGYTIIISPASRYTVAVDIPTDGSGLELVMPPMRPQDWPSEGFSLTQYGISYIREENNISAALGNWSIELQDASWFDGFFYWPVQTLLTVDPTSTKQVGNATSAFYMGAPLNGVTSFVDLRDRTVNFTREFVIKGSFTKPFNDNDPQGFLYFFNDYAFPYSAVVQPRLESVEVWNFANVGEDQHPIHIHINDYQVLRVIQPGIEPVDTGARLWSVDNANIPAPVDGEMGYLSLANYFQEYLGPYVFHCHRLNHEDNGLMLIINTIPARSIYAFSPGGGEVTVHDHDDIAVCEEFMALPASSPFPAYTGELSIAVGDVNGDAILDLIVSEAPEGCMAGECTPQIVVWDGADDFQTVVARFDAFDETFEYGVSVSVGTIDGNGQVWNILAASVDVSGFAQLRVFHHQLPDLVGEAPAVWSEFTPFPFAAGPVSVTSGLINAGKGRDSILVAPLGDDMPSRVVAYTYDLYSDIAEVNPDDNVPSFVGKLLAPRISGGAKRNLQSLTDDKPILTADWYPFGENATGGLSMAVAWTTVSVGGSMNVVVGQMTGDEPAVSVWTAGNHLLGNSEVYGFSVNDDEEFVTMHPILEPWTPPPDVSNDLHVSLVTTIIGADLVIVGNNGTTTNLHRYQLVEDIHTNTSLAVYGPQYNYTEDGRPATDPTTIEVGASEGVPAPTASEGIPALQSHSVLLTVAISAAVIFASL